MQPDCQRERRVQGLGWSLGQCAQGPVEDLILPAEGRGWRDSPMSQLNAPGARKTVLWRQCRCPGPVGALIGSCLSIHAQCLLGRTSEKRWWYWPKGSNNHGWIWVWGAELLWGPELARGFLEQGLPRYQTEPARRDLAERGEGTGLPSPCSAPKSYWLGMDRKERVLSWGVVLPSCLGKSVCPSSGKQW